MAGYKVRIMIVAAFAAGIALVGCSDKKGDGKVNLPKVQVANPIKKSVELWDEYVARIDAVRYVEVRARVGGYLEKVNFTEGEKVKEGDLLFVIDPRPFEAQVQAAKAQVKEVESRVVLAKNNLERGREMLAAKVVSKEVFETRNAELLGAQAALLNAQANLRDAELNLEFTHVKAPISGRVSEALVDAGNLVAANTTLLTAIVKDDVVQAYFEISERDFLRYEKDGLFKRINIAKGTGPEAQIMLLGDSETKINGVVNYYDNRIGRETSSLTMRADIDNSEGKLAAGMFAKIRVKASSPREVLLVPEDVIGTDLVNRYVLVVGKDNKVEYRMIKPGRLLGKYRIVEEGVSEGDRIVVVGLHNANPGRIVNPVPAAEAKSK